MICRLLPYLYAYLSIAPSTTRYILSKPFRGHFNLHSNLMRNLFLKIHSLSIFGKYFCFWQRDFQFSFSWWLCKSALKFIDFCENAVFFNSFFSKYATLKEIVDKSKKIRFRKKFILAFDKAPIFFIALFFFPLSAHSLAAPRSFLRGELNDRPNGW